VHTGIGWLSSSAAEISRARQLLKTMTQSGVIDELGFLILLGAFADHFYPAITTPMTRARYLIFVPAIYQYIEHSGRAVGRDVDRLARDTQFSLLQALLRNEHTAIGKEGGRLIVRTPADIYWSALGTLGIATKRISEASYQAQLRAGAFNRATLKDDDNAVHPDEQESLWHASLRLSQVMPDGVFPASTDFRLRKNEATFLAARYADLRPGGRPCLVSHLVELSLDGRMPPGADIASVWEIPFLSQESGAAADHARRLSLFARGTTLMYHQMLIEKRRITEKDASPAFSAWWERARDDLGGWDVDAFFALVTSWNANRRPKQDRAFLQDWIGRCVAARSAADALADRTARSVVETRERVVRPGKERLRVEYQLKAWNPAPAYRPDNLYQLEYRHSVGARFAHDIAEGITRGTA
jgi:hypothetical protein